MLGELRVAPDVVVEVGVAAVDDRVAGLEVLQELPDLLLGGVAGGTMIQATRGFASFPTSSSTLSAAVRSWPPAASSVASSWAFSTVRL